MDIEEKEPTAGYAASLAEAIGHLCALKASGGCSVENGRLIERMALALAERLRTIEAEEA